MNIITKYLIGNWSDGSDYWTEEILLQLGKPMKADDGIFYMELDDFKKYFAFAEICMFQNGYKYSSIKCEC